MELHVLWQFTSSGTYHTFRATPHLVKIKISTGDFTREYLHVTTCGMPRLSQATVESSVDAKYDYIILITDVDSSKVDRIDTFSQVNRGQSCTKPCDMHSPINLLCLQSTVSSNLFPNTSPGQQVYKINVVLT